MASPDHVALELAEARRGTGSYPDMVLDWWLTARGRTIRRSPRARIAYLVKVDTPPEYNHPGSLYGAAIACERIPAREHGGNEPRLAFNVAAAMEWADL